MNMEENMKKYSAELENWIRADIESLKRNERSRDYLMKWRRRLMSDWFLTNEKKKELQNYYEEKVNAATPILTEKKREKPSIAVSAF